MSKPTGDSHKVVPPGASTTTNAAPSSPRSPVVTKGLLAQLGNKCIVCNEIQDDVRGLLKHMESHDPFIPVTTYEADCRLPNGLFECIVCGKQLTTIYTLRRHYASHVKETPFKCPKCPSAFKTSGHFTGHFRRVHLGGPRLRCPKCDFSTTCASFLKAHMRRHETRSERCEVCFKLFRPGYLAHHYKLHTGGRMFKCGVCGSGHTTKGALKVHLEQVHLREGKVNKRGRSDGPSSCRGVPYAYGDVAEELNYRCVVCDESLAYGINFVDHLKSHDTPVPISTCHLPNGHYQCDVCGKQRMHKSTLIRHYCSHFKEGLFKCPRCPLAFKTAACFLIHVRTHIKKSETKRKEGVSRPMRRRCREAPANFPRRSRRKERCEVCFKLLHPQYLESHYMLHTGERMFKCGVCSRGQTSRNTLKTHLERVHLRKGRVNLRRRSDGPSSCRGTPYAYGDVAEELNYRCVVCGESLIYGINFVDHLKSHDASVPISACRLPNGHYQCDVCGMQWMHKSSFIRHYRSHHKERPFKCPRCPLAFKTAAYFLFHFRRIHTNKSKTKRKEHTSCSPMRRRSREVPAKFPRHSHDKERCEVCFKLLRPRYLERHYMLHTGERMFKCGVCGSGHTAKGALKAHLEQVHLRKGKVNKRGRSDGPSSCRGIPYAYGDVAEELNYRCVVCDESLVYGINFVDHLKSHDTPVPISACRLPNGHHQCDICGQQQTHKSAFIRHYCSHFEERPFKCPRCPLAFKTATRFLIHFRRIHNEAHARFPQGSRNSKERCEVCFKMVTAKGLDKHYMLHTGERPFECHECGRGFRTNDRLRNHKCRTHAPADTKRGCLSPAARHGSSAAAHGSTTIWELSGEIQAELRSKCIVCHQVQAYGTNFYEHMRSHNPVIPVSDYMQHCYLPNGLYQCIVCGKQYAKEVSIRNHFIAHSDERPFKCPKCPSASKTALSFMTHFKRIHLDGPLYKCSKCTFTTRWDSALTTHLRAHSNNGYKERCEVCFKWRRGSYLTQHYMTHTGESPFQCNECGTQVRTETLLKRHIKNMHIDQNGRRPSTSERGYILISPGTSKRALSGDPGSCLTGLGNKCIICNKVQGPGINIWDHLRSHDPIAPAEECRLPNGHYKCSVCGKGIQYESHFRDHFMQHADEGKPFKCPNCPAAFKTTKCFRKHFTSIHIRGQSFRCLKCDFTCPWRYRMKKHLLTHPSD